MKTLLTAINSKYIHTSLAVWYLKASCDSECGTVDIAEFTINDSMDSIMGRIYNSHPDVIAFSCYIWNIDYVMKLSRELKKILPNIIIILGGPEVSFDGEDILKEHDYIDFVLSGEGEISFKQLLNALISGLDDLHNIRGLTYRLNENIITNGICTIVENLDLLPSPYTDEMLNSIGNRIVYYEASRGCPFSCSYCLSSVSAGVRNFSMERVESDLDRLVSAGVRQIKFVDRTFNSNKKRAVQILKLIIDKYGNNDKDINFHFEAAADLFNDEMFEILAKAPVGLIQFEIGVQTTNEETLKLINRKTSNEEVFSKTNMLKSIGKTHIHMDLIAGLPKENYSSFKKSFDDVYRIEPHQLQLGFLKMLKGARIRGEAEKYGYKYRDYAPYEVLENDYISFDEIYELKGIEELVDRYYNSGKFMRILDYATNIIFDSPFMFYKSLLDFYKSKDYIDRGISGREAFNILSEFLKCLVNEDKHILINDLLKFDYLSSDNTNNLPTGIDRSLEPDFREKCFTFLKDEYNIKDVLPQFIGVPVKQIIKNVHFEIFEHNFFEKMDNYYFNKVKMVVLFDYTKRDRVTGLYKSTAVKLDN